MNDTLNLFKAPRALDSVAHRELRFTPNQPYHYAAKQLFAPVTLTEASLVAHEYVIVFSDQKDSLPMALLGRARGSNAYVRASGHWTARYVPAHIRRYPFVMAERPLNPDATGATELEQVVMFDSEAPHLSEQTGVRLLDEQGVPTSALRSVMEVLVAMQRDSQATLQIVQQLEALGLLMEHQYVVASKKGQPIGLTGLRAVNFEKLNQLTPEQLAELRASGALDLIYAHKISLSNLQNSVLVDNDEQQAPSNSSGSISFEGIDWSKF